MEGDQGPLLVSGRGKVGWRGGTECSYKRTYIRMYVHMYVCMYVRAYVCVYVCTYVRMYVCAYVHLLSPTDLCGIYCTHSLGSVYLLLSSLYWLPFSHGNLKTGSNPVSHLWRCEMPIYKLGRTQCVNQFTNYCQLATVPACTSHALHMHFTCTSTGGMTDRIGNISLSTPPNVHTYVCTHYLLYAKLIVCSQLYFFCMLVRAS